MFPTIRIAGMLFAAILLTSPLLVAQSGDNWKKLASKAEELLEENKFAEAGDHYYKAWQLKQKKTELAFMAGECYYAINDYAKAAKAYKPVKEQNDDFHHVGLKYARSLKSMEEYDEAGREFVYFINSYSGDDYQNVAILVQNEILGCEMATQADAPKDESATVKHLGDQINGPTMEYAPVPYTDDILYFSSDSDGQSKVYRSQKLDGTWGQHQLTEQVFDQVEDKHYGNISFSPDKKRFYFTQCEDTKTQQSRCEIYLMESNDDGTWTNPQRLPDYVNDPEATTTQPSVIHTDKVEVIYFTSNREGGQGGMDIWYISRNLESTRLDYTFPKNLGPKVNTPGDESTPFCDGSRNALYFSSNGHVGFGGYDIFRAEGQQSEWTAAKNIGKPYNSSADDRYFVYEKSPSDGFFISNRTSDLSKLSTTHEDIFSFSAETDEALVVQGKLVADKDGSSLAEVKVTLFQVLSNGKKRVLDQKTTDGKYEFPLLEDKSYVLQIEKNGYNKQEIDLNTKSKSSGAIQHDVRLTAFSITVANNDPVLDDKTKTKAPNVNVNPGGSPPSNPGTDEPIKSLTEPDQPIVPDEPAIADGPDFDVDDPDLLDPTLSDSAITDTPDFDIDDPDLPDPNPNPTDVAAEEGPTDPPTPSGESGIADLSDLPSGEDPADSFSKETVDFDEPDTPPATEPAPPTPAAESDFENHWDTDEPPAPSDDSLDPSTTPSDSGEEGTPNSNPNSDLPPATDASWYPNHGTSGSSSSSDGGEMSSSAGTRHHLNNTTDLSGTYYKVQMVAMKHFNENSYDDYTDLGNIETEYIADKDWVRVMVGNFTDKDEAIAARNEIRLRGYDRAYCVKYRDGKRVAIKVFYDE